MIAAKYAFFLLAFLVAIPRPGRAENPLSAESLDLLQKIVDINSGTANAEGLDRVRAVLIPKFEALGFRATVRPVSEGHKILSFEFPGAQPDLLLVGHVDTVFPKDSPFQNFSAASDRLGGPGVIDMKGGLVLMLDALTELKDPALLKRVRIAINDDEEIGSIFSRDALKDLGRGIPSGLVFEPGLPDGALVTAHSGVHWLQLKVRGKAAHAGLEPEKGINACVELAHKIVQIRALADPARRLTVNVGVIAGGTTPNVVCEEASAKIDIRFIAQPDLDHTLEKIRKIAADARVKNALTGTPTATEISDLAHIPSMPEKFSKSLFGLAKAAGTDVGQKIAGRPVGYGSDANGLAALGMNLLVGLGPYGSGMHSAAEQMIPRSYAERLRLDVALIKSILEQPALSLVSGR